MNRAELLAELTADKAELWADDETVGYRLVVEPDYDSSINDSDCYGKVSSYIEYMRNKRPRPEGFTGAAVKIAVDRSGFVWWEPYREGSKVYNGPEDRELVTRLLQEGFTYVAVVKLRQCDMGHVHELDRAGLGGIDSLENGYLAEVVDELLDELGAP